MKTQIIQILISFYLINLAETSPKTSAETGNDIEKFLLEGNSVKELSPKTVAEKKPDKFMEDLIEVQRTYRSLKEKWQRMMEEKNQVLKAASSSSTTTPAPPISSEIQEIDVDVFEAPDKFQDISQDTEKSEFDDESFVDISMTSSTPGTTTVPPTTTIVTQTTTKSELAEIQNAIRDAFQSPPSLFEILGPTTKTTVTPQMDATVTTLKIDETTPPTTVTTVVPRNQQAPELTMLNVQRRIQKPLNPSSPSQIQDHAHKTLSSETVGTVPSDVASPWRKTSIVPEEIEKDPFEGVTSSESPVMSSESPLTSSETPPPQHILPTSSFHSSGSHPDSQPSTNLFRYPDQVQIPFFGAKKDSKKSGNSESPTTSAPMRPTTPEPFRSDEIQEETEEKEEVVASDPNDVEDQESQESEFLEDEESDDSEDVTAPESTTMTIENNEDYVEETFSKEIGTSEAQNLNLDSELESEPQAKSEASKTPESFAISKSSEIFGSPPGSQRPKAFGTVPSSLGPRSSEFGFFGGAPPGSGPEPPGPAPSGPAHFGIGRSPPGFSDHIGPTLPPSSHSEKPGLPFPTLVDQVENFFNEGDEKSTEDTGASSALGSFASAEVVKNVPISQSIQVLDDPGLPTPGTPKDHMATSKVGIFGTKLQTINQRAYKPPMFPSSLSSETVKMMPLGNPYLQRTTVQPIGPHGLLEPKMEVNSVDTELPAWGGVEKDRGIMNKARREYQKEFEQQIRDVRIIDEEINKISKMNDEGRSKVAQRCSQVYAHTLSLPQIQKMSLSLGLADVATVIQKAADLVEHQENDIAQLELDLEEKRKLIAKIEILLSLSESRALLFDLLNEQKKIAEKMENHALDLLQKNNFRPHTPSPFSAASDISELSSAVRQVLNQKSITMKKGPGWSMMKRKLHKKSKIPIKKIEVISPADVIIKNNFIDFNKKTGHLQETAEIVEPVLSVPFVSQNDQFGRQPVAVAVHRRPPPPLPLAPPTMRPTILVRQPRPSQLAAMHLPVRRPLAAPESSRNSESETVHELIDMLHEDIVKLPAEEEEKVCKNVQCDFEKADLCNYESSHDETTRFRFSKNRRQKRESQFSDDLLAESSNIADDLLPYTFRAWSIWAGRRADRQKQIDIGPTYSTRNLHFAAVFLEPQQAGILSIPLILSPTATKIRLRIFEGTRGIRLRICCDRYCPLETEQGLYRGHRNWLRKTVTCPANTQTLSFECLNDGPDRGACGVDDIFVDSSRCQKFFKGADQN